MIGYLFVDLGIRHYGRPILQLILLIMSKLGLRMYLKREYILELAYSFKNQMERHQVPQEDLKATGLFSVFCVIGMQQK